MATPCISSPKVDVHQNLQPRSSKTESRSKNCSARHIDCDNLRRCRFAYASWCPVCEEQEWSKKAYYGNRRRSKSEGMETERSEDYYTKTTNHHSDVRFTKEHQCYRREDKYVDHYDSLVGTEQINMNRHLPEVHSLSQTYQIDNAARNLKHVRRPCENHIEPNCIPNSGWSSLSSDKTFPCKGNELIPLHERYYYEVEMLRSKLNRLREYPVDGKRVRQASELQCNVSELGDGKRVRQASELQCNISESGFKRPREAFRPHSTRKLLPTVPPSKNSAYYSSALQSIEPSVLRSSSSTSVSSDSELNYSGCDEEQLNDDDNVEEEELSFLGPQRLVSSSASPSYFVSSISINEHGVGEIVAHTGKLHPSLRASLFSHIPPYIRFSSHELKGDELPACIQKLLKWKLSTITPVVVRRTIVNSNFKLVRKSNEWCGTWGKHMKSLCFKTLREYQKINHFPGTFQIGRKDRLWKNLFRLMTKFGKKEFGFIPRTYVLPQDSKLLRSAWEKNCGKEKWIVKPPASARGTGIRVIHKWTQIPKKCPLVVQKYIADPYLINGSKFDLRLYVLVTSINPLRIYMYDNGLVRFASVKYSNEMTSLADRYMHLTNYSINKLSSQYTQNEDASACQGHKWSLQALWTYLENDRRVDVKALQEHLVDLVIKTIISGESAISTLSQTNLASRYCSYELFGIDVLLDENLKPWLLEVNISPSLHSSSPLDLAVKGPMVRDLMNMAGYQIPNKLSSQMQADLAESLGLDSALCFDRRLYTMALSNEERLKHITFQQMEVRDDYLEAILQDLTPDDVRHLVAYEDELTQLGNFKKVFPTTETYDYHQFFEAPRYYNMLFDAWEVRQSNDRTKGIALLESLCKKQVHLDTTQIPPKRTKVSMSQSSSDLKNQELDLQEESQGVSEETTHSVVPDKNREKWTVTLACDTICRAARPRSGKPGLITKPYPRSAYIARRPIKSAHIVS